ncbi:MAG: DUF2383 domain-containing protein [Myxococcota bacterium]
MGNHTPPATYEVNIEQLNSFLRGELSSLETYQQTIDKMDPEDTLVLDVLRRCKRSHEERVERLRREITALGRETADGTGPWGAFAKLAQRTAKLFGEKAAISMLQEGEDHGLNDCRGDLDDFDPSVRAFVETEILPAQQRTHDSLNELQQAL